jgi:transposase-like protein
MARNVVQFQKGLSEPAFEKRYGSEEQCRAVVIASRWRYGFECPACGGKQYSLVTTRDLYQCTSCRRQTSPIAGTIFASTHLPLRLWFPAIYHLTQTKQGISSIELGRRLGVRQSTAWTIKHKLKQVMLERDASKRLTGRVEIDDADLGGERSGGKRGRGAPGKTPFVVAVETTAEGKPVRLKLQQVTASATSQSPPSPSAASIQAALGSAMGFSVSAACPMPGVPTRSSRPGQDPRRLARRPSNGPTRHWATSDDTILRP